MLRSLVGSEMCIRDRVHGAQQSPAKGMVQDRRNLPLQLPTHVDIGSMNFLHSGNLLPRRDIHPAPMQGRHGTCKVHPGKAEWDKLCLSSAAANHSPNPVWKLKVSAPTARDTNTNPQCKLSFKFHLCFHPVLLLDVTNPMHSFHLANLVECKTFVHSCV